MGNFLRLVGALALIALVASFGLSAIYGATHDITEAYKQAEEAQARVEALACDPGAFFVETATESLVGGQPFSYYTAHPSEESDEILGYSFTAYGVGYSSTIVTIVGVDVGGMICGVRITDQKETPGLGSKIQEIASQNTLWAVMSGNAVDESGVKPWFQKQFESLSANGLTVVKTTGEEGILAVTGATISSEAVTASVSAGLRMLQSIVGIDAAQTSPGDDAPGEASGTGSSDGDDAVAAVESGEGA